MLHPLRIIWKVKLNLSHKSRSSQRRGCSYEGIDPCELIIDVKTQWNSTYGMIECALKMRPAIDTFIANSKIEEISKLRS